MSHEDLEDRLVRTSGVCALIGLSRASIYRLEANDPTFPRRIKLTERASAFHLLEIKAWMASRPRAADLAA